MSNQVVKVYLGKEGRRFYRYRGVDSRGKAVFRQSTKLTSLTENERMQMCCQKLADIRAGNWRPKSTVVTPSPVRGMTLVESVAEHVKRSPERRATTLADDRRAVEALAEAVGGNGVKLADIGPEHVQTLLAKLKERGFKRSTRDAYLRRLCHYWHLAISRGWTEGPSPFSRSTNKELPRPKPIQASGRFFTREEVSAMIDASPDRWWHGLISLLGNSGLRRGEALYLRRGAVTNGAHYKLKLAPQQAETWTDPQTGADYSLPPWSSKTGTPRSYRTLPIPNETAEALAAVETGTPYHFIDLPTLRQISRLERAGRWPSNRSPIHPKKLYGPFKEIQLKAARAMGSSEWRLGGLHDLRKAYLSNMAEHVPAPVLQALAGHDSLATTMSFYQDPDRDSTAKILEALA